MPSESIEEWRALRNQQDKEYEESLRADQEKVIFYIVCNLSVSVILKVFFSGCENDK